MNRKLLAFLMALLIILSIMQYPMLVVADSLVFHDMGDYRVRHNLDGTTTIQEEIEFQSEFANVFTPGSRLMSISIGDMSISFSPVMLEGQVTIEIPMEDTRSF
jgi:hypothetical protein